MVNFALDIVVGFFVVRNEWRTSGYERRFSAFEKFCKLEFLSEFVGIYRFG